LDGNLISDSSKGLKISYDWRGMPVEFRLEPTGSSSDTTRLVMMYDGSGRRISKTFLTKSATAASWDTVKVTHYTGIGTEVREEFHNGSRERVSVVVNMPQGLGRYKVADASQPADDNTSRTFEWYLKNHLGSTMLVYGTVVSTDPNTADIGETKATYDYRAFGEMVTLTQPSDKVTENFTGKERDDETKLNYFGARYLDPMIGVWTSVDPKRQFASPYLYAGNGYNPVNGTDGDGNVFVDDAGKALYQRAVANRFWGNENIRREYEFANTTSTRISVKTQYDLIKGNLSGLTERGGRDEMEIDYGDVSDDYKLKEAVVTLSIEGVINNAELTNTSYSEAEARIAAHEFGAHIRNFTPNYGPHDESPVDIEHDKFKAVDQRLDTPRDGCLDDK